MSGNFFANPFSMMGASTIANRSKLPSGIGNASVSGFVRAAAVNSRGAWLSVWRIAVESIVNGA
jgi:hypothetical protein